MLDQDACATGSNPHQFTYNAENQLTSTAGVDYVYDGVGNRVEKYMPSTTPPFYELYWYGLNNDPLDETDGTGSTTNSAFNEYVFLNGARTARRNAAGNVFYYFADHLGTSRDIVQAASSTPCYDADFTPYGVEIPYTDTCPQNYKFTGKERDTESNNDDFSFRYYSSYGGRFLSVDPLQNNPILPLPPGLNRYAYADNNPLRYFDPNGLCSTPSGIGAGDIGICIDAFISAPRVGRFGWGFGDDRGPRKNDTEHRYRYQAQIVVDPTTGRISSESGINTSCAIRPTWCFMGTKSDKITPGKDANGNTLIAIQATLANGWRDWGGPWGTIRIQLWLVVSPNRNLAIESKSRSTPFPSLEVFTYDSNGQATQGWLAKEGNESGLNGPMQPINWLDLSPYLWGMVENFQQEFFSPEWGDAGSSSGGAVPAGHCCGIF